jgi:hypothetical protein
VNVAVAAVAAVAAVVVAVNVLSHTPSLSVTCRVINFHCVPRRAHQKTLNVAHFLRDPLLLDKGHFCFHRPSITSTLSAWLVLCFLVMANPFGEGLSPFCNSSNSICKYLGFPSSLDVVPKIDNEGNIHRPGAESLLTHVDPQTLTL